MNKKLKCSYYSSRLSKPFNCEDDQNGTNGGSKNCIDNYNGKNNGINSNFINYFHNRGSTCDKKMWSSIRNLNNKSNKTP